MNIHMHIATALAFLRARLARIMRSFRRFWYTLLRVLTTVIYSSGRFWSSALPRVLTTLRHLFHFSLRDVLNWLKIGSVGCGCLLYVFIILLSSSLIVIFSDAVKALFKRNALAVFFVFLLVSLPFVIKKLYSYRDTSRMMPVMLLGVLYIQVVLVYSVIFYSIYLFDASAYVFAGPLEDKQATLFFMGQYKQAQQRQEHLYNIALWKQWLFTHSDADFEEARRRAYNLVAAGTGVDWLSFEFCPGHSIALHEFFPKDTGIITYHVVFRDATNRFIARGVWHILRGRFPEAAIVTAPSRLEHVKALGGLEHKLRGEVEELLRAMRKSGYKWPLWGYLEFVYFSASAMTTASYGDIIPNSGIVRFLTTTEVITGVFLVAFGLRLFIKNKQGTDPD